MNDCAAPLWLPAARQAAHRPANTLKIPRVPFLVNGVLVGSIAKSFLDQIGLQRLLDKRYQLLKTEHGGQPACELNLVDGMQGQDSTVALNALAHVLRETGQCGPWRNEQVAVCDPHGAVIGTVERGAVRVLGIATRAVHLVGSAPNGSLWVQQRALSKPNNPGLWDTLMGGMVSAADTLAQALQRETWEEAGLRIDALQDLAHGGHIDFAHPSDEAGGLGYLVERIDWYSATVPQGIAPVNQDGEVALFELLPRAEVLRRLAQGVFTPQAALVLAGFYGW